MARIEHATTIICVCQSCDWTFDDFKPKGWGDIWYEVHSQTHANDTGHKVLIAWTRTAEVNDAPDDEDDEEET